MKQHIDNRKEFLGYSCLDVAQRDMPPKICLDLGTARVLRSTAFCLTQMTAAVLQRGSVIVADLVLASGALYAVR